MLAASKIAEAKIKTGMNNGTTSKLSNTPPLRNPTVNATPIAPMQLKNRRAH